ncbi:MAG: ribosome assembly factor SBDS [Thaumarchaeota archaeon]|jgi:ribosome maturation protein SDO1|nr:ribosome assembly factor SBDS [Candidatus Terraquivivens yellowstonensis]MCL7387575.1 ribosome assembly factor SBDS [Candidatus Terraquivivens yellowstonensis]MCL7392980.1 ribosome assembly factor SBDS [Candidatus Terraquivivens yellowstonensis]MCL7395399.1 ribosome assembly factor SBDS [Candidatus Terraquivivens yellowstonensis]MCL7398005.1 ribosome assembly factor SBDS [Candidatus Terraquivivens yellowstonensis]
MTKQKESYTIARLVRGDTFEILVDPDNALKYKMGEKIPISKVLIYEEIYTDAKKGIRASEEQLLKAFKTKDKLAIATKILTEGTLQITSEQRHRLIEEKKRQIIEFISKSAVDPRTKLPHPPQRVELAMEQAGISIDPFIDAKEQAMKVIEKLSPILPMKVGMTRMYVRVPGEYVGKAYGLLKNIGKILKEEYKGDGSWVGEVEILVGLQADLIEKLNKLCSGRVEARPME